MPRRDLYLAVLPHAGHRYAVVTDGDLNTAAAYRSRDTAVSALRRTGPPAPADGYIDLGRPGTIAEKVAGMTERHARARSGDRRTSHDAARSINPDTVRGRVLFMLHSRCGGAERFTLSDVVAWYGQEAAMGRWPRASDSSVRTRVSELVDDGFVRSSGERVRLSTGRWATAFALAV